MVQETPLQWAKRNSNPNNKKVKCGNLNSKKPNCYPYGYEQCTVSGKVCLFQAYGYDKKDCECFKAVPKKVVEPRSYPEEDFTKLPKPEGLLVETKGEDYV